MGRITDAVTGVSGILESLGLQVHTEPPGSVVAPAAFVGLADIDYGDTFDRQTDSVPLIIDLFCSSSPEGLETLYEYLDMQGDKSIVTAIDANPTLDGVAEFVIVRDAQSPDRAEMGQSEYYHSRLNLDASLLGAGQ